jgi:hypothetical protein
MTMTTDDEETVAAYRGVIRIEWPASHRPGPHGCMLGRAVSVFDAASGELITTCSHADIVIHADVDALVTADLTLFTDEDGEPLLDGEPVAKDSEFLTGTFPFLVGEMRVRQS